MTATPQMFTDIQIEYATCIVRGMSNEEIARFLCRAPRTVRNMTHTLYKQVGAKNRAHFVFVMLSEYKRFLPKDVLIGTKRDAVVDRH